MGIKAAFLLLLVFASIAFATNVTSVPIDSSRVVFYGFERVAAFGNSLVEPFGDPIDDPGFPH